MDEKKYDDKNKGALWVNKYRTQDWHSEYTGNVNVEGVVYKVYCSKNSRYEESTNTPYFELKIELPNSKEEETTSNATEVENSDPFGDDVPF